MITRNHGHIPTVEMPFPDAILSMENPRPKMNANPHNTLSAAAPAVVPPSPPPAVRPIQLPRPRPAAIVRKTLDGVRAMPLWRTPIPPAIFFSIIGILFLALVVIVFSIRSKRTAIPPVDTA